MRQLARQTLPFGLRARWVLARRALADRWEGHRFATRTGRLENFRFELASYDRRFIDYPGQEHLGWAKRHNQRVMASSLDRRLIGPGEVFSLWRLAGRPTAEAGYEPAAALKNRRLITEVGGATCLLSTVVYNVALLAAMEILERRCHSVDSYGDHRYFEIGRDATIEWPYIDLRFRNPHPYSVLLSFDISDQTLRAELRGPVRRDFDVELSVVDVTFVAQLDQVVSDARVPVGDEKVVDEGLAGLRARTLRRVVRAGTDRIEDLGVSYHHPLPRVIARSRLN